MIDLSTKILLGCILVALIFIGVNLDKSNTSTKYQYFSEDSNMRAINVKTSVVYTYIPTHGWFTIKEMQQLSDSDAPANEKPLP